MYSPQIVENYTLKSGEGLSVLFVVIWLLGDVTNLLGAVMAGLLTTVIILAAYVRPSSGALSYESSRYFFRAVQCPTYGCCQWHIEK